MRAFKAELAKLENSKPIFTCPAVTRDSDDARYSKTIYLDAERVTHLADITQEGMDVYLAKRFFQETWDRHSASYHTDYYEATKCLRESMERSFLNFVTNHSPAKHPKNTKLYELAGHINGYINTWEQAGEDFYSLYKYIETNCQKGTESTNIHVQNSLKILELLCNRYEGKN